MWNRRNNSRGRRVKRAVMVSSVLYVPVEKIMIRFKTCCFIQLTCVNGRHVFSHVLGSGFNNSDHGATQEEKNVC